MNENDYWAGKNVMVTGGSGFLGTYVVDELRSRTSDRNIGVPRSREYDLRERANVRRAITDYDPDVIIHLAANVGGIGANEANPARQFYDNAIMGIELLDAARKSNVDKLTVIGTSCAYPEDATVPFSEDDLFAGYPEETTAPYAIAKRSLLTQSWAYRKQYGFNSIYLIPTNLYGPGDDFDLETAHVIPAIIRKCLEAQKERKNSITAWGTGKPTREFLYVEDAAEAIVRATEKYDDPEPVNIGTSQEISIRKLVANIKELTGFTGDVVWDTSKPDGQPRLKFDISRMEELIGWEASTSLQEGLERTVAWYEEQYEALV